MQLFVSGGNMYTPTKYGLKGLAELLRFELIPHNIKVSLACPGFTETPMLDDGKLSSHIKTPLICFNLTSSTRRDGLARGDMCDVHIFCLMGDVADKADASTSNQLRKIQFYDRANAESAGDVAAKTMEGAKEGRFLITTSTTGFLLGVLGRGFVPTDSLAEALIELLLLVPARLFSFLWFAYAKRVSMQQ